MENDYLFSIGKASKLCHISRKALRFYDEMGIISPDAIGDNGYRYYSKETLLTIPVIKYYKQMGFKLTDMREFIRGSTYSKIQRSFKNRIAELNVERAVLDEQFISVNDWLDLIIEAGAVIDCNAMDVGVKYFDATEYLFLDQPYNPNHKDAIINIEFTNYVESVNNAITGPVIRYFSSFRDRMAGNCRTQRMLQKTVLRCLPEQIKPFGGGVMLSCYHIGEHEQLNRTYEKMLRWAGDSGYVCGADAYERYVTDYWTTGDLSQHVTEILINISRKTQH